MNKPILMLLLIVLSSSLQAQEMPISGKDYIITKDPKNESKDIVIGQVSPEIIMDVDTEGWLADGMEYSPDPESIKTISKSINEYVVYAFIGTWCSDTHDLFPKFLSVLQASNIDKDNLKIYAVDRDKKALNIEDQIFDIQRVPTFIFFQRNTEKGRIVERVEKNIESSILDILEK